MREIEFRGFSIQLNKWVYGHLCTYFNNTNTCIMPDGYFVTRNFGEVNANGTPKLEDEFAIGGWIQVDPKSVGQYTGVKDKNGIKIYEGHIVKRREQNDGIRTYKEQNFEVYYNQDKDSNNCRFELKDGGIFDGIWTDWLEVVGNIYENPELLK